MSNKFDEFLSGIDGIKLENGSELQHSMEIVFVMILIIRIIRFTNVHMSF